MIRKQDLGQLDFIAEGGVGKVYRLPGYHVPGCSDLAYKEIKPVGPGQNQLSAATRRQALDAMAKSVAFRAGLSAADRDDLDEYTTWPIAMVEDRGGPCGLVMPLIPADFFTQTAPPGGAGKKIVFDLSWLCAKDIQAQNAGVDRSPFQDFLTRLALLVQLVYAVGRLHVHGVVYGDLSLKNVALAANPPRIKLLDCDAAAPLADPTREQMHSPGFTPPEIVSGAQKLQDDRTDIYKLGLCVIRGLQQGRGVSQVKDPAGLVGKLDAHTIDVLTRAVGVDRAARPTAKELVDSLENNLLAKAAPPTLHSVSLSRAALPRGMDVEVVWEATGGRDVRITGSNGLDITLPDPGTSPARFVVTPRASGDVSVEVTNSHGTAWASAGRVDLYDLPGHHVDLTGLPRPVMSSVPAVAIPPVLHALPPVPTVSTARHAVPRIELPSLAPVADAVSMLRAVPHPFGQLVNGTAAGPVPVHPDMGALATQATDSVNEIFDNMRERLREHVAQEVAAALRQGGKRP